MQTVQAQRMSMLTTQQISCASAFCYLSLMMSGPKWHGDSLASGEAIQLQLPGNAAFCVCMWQVKVTGARAQRWKANNKGMNRKGKGKAMTLDKRQMNMKWVSEELDSRQVMQNINSRAGPNAPPSSHAPMANVQASDQTCSPMRVRWGTPVSTVESHTVGLGKAVTLGKAAGKTRRALTHLMYWVGEHCLRLDGAMQRGLLRVAAQEPPGEHPCNSTQDCNRCEENNQKLPLRRNACARGCKDNFCKGIQYTWSILIEGCHSTAFPCEPPRLPFRCRRCRKQWRNGLRPTDGSITVGTVGGSYLVASCGPVTLLSCASSWSW